jgi:hypothetical protein
LSGDTLPLLLLGSSLGLALGSAWYAWRLAFDRPLFAAWAQLPEDECAQAQRDFDSALRSLLKRSFPADNSRAMPVRVRATRNLLGRQIIGVLGQMLVFVALLTLLAVRQGAVC